MGEQLLSEVAKATGLPEKLISDELNRLLTAAGVQPNELTLDDLRSVLANYVQDILLDVRAELSDLREKKASLRTSTP